MANKHIKVKVLERNDTFFLIERYYPKLMTTEFIVCIGYDFKSNTYFDGLRIANIQASYSVFNDLVKNKKLPAHERKIEENDE